ncbi:hypothetical protein [Haladaptatus sp. DFWS20]
MKRQNAIVTTSLESVLTERANGTKGLSNYPPVYPDAISATPDS